MSSNPNRAPRRARLLLAEARRILALAAPIVIALSTAVLIGVVDTIMVAPLGTEPLAAVALVSAAMLIFYSGVYGFIARVGVEVAEAAGRRDAPAVAAATASGLATALIVGALAVATMAALLPTLGALGQPREVLGLLPAYWLSMAASLLPFALFYMLKGVFDALERPWIGVWFGFFAVGLNVPANYLLIYGVGTWEGLGLVGLPLAYVAGVALEGGPVAVWLGYGVGVVAAAALLARRLLRLTASPQRPLGLKR